MTMMLPFCDPILSEVIPIKKGTTAPPKIPVIISPEISLALSGLDFNAIENNIENVLAIEKPMTA